LHKTFTINRLASVCLLSLLVFSTIGLSNGPVAAEGRLYVPDEGSAHCTLWDNLRLKWPQTIMGRETAKCRRRAVPPTEIASNCRLRREYFDDETGQRMCVYMKPGRGAEDKTISLSPSLQCQRSYTCPMDD
jgi:hypothetical protein